MYSMYKLHTYCILYCSDSDSFFFSSCTVQYTVSTYCSLLKCVVCGVSCFLVFFSL